MNDPWSKIAVGAAQRVKADGKFDFFWAKFDGNNPGLMLRLPEGIKEIHPVPKLKNIDVKYSSSFSRAFTLRLRDASQKEIFETLCRDVVDAGEAAATADSALSRAIRRTRRWHFLLQGGSSKGLSIEQQRGLVGELAFLRSLCLKLGPAGAIDAWKGPEGASKDFEFPEICVEIKARRGAAKPHVKISSEDQLTSVEGARLFLRVYDVDSAVKPDGANLHDHVNMTSDLFKQDDGAFERWQILIDATGYDEGHEYGDRRWIIGKERSYEVIDGFPRLPSPLLEGVTNVSYSVSLNACEPFLASEDVLVVAKGQING